MPDLQELREFQQNAFPQSLFEIIAIGPMCASLRHNVSDSDLRPGGTLCGPTMFALADNALYMATLGEVGLHALTVTTSMSINFLRKPEGATDLIGECRLLKLGKALAVGEIFVYSKGVDEPVAHTTGTYSIPPVKS